jgi:predicted phage terminase large subunit-like protein
MTRWHEDDLIGRLTDPTNPCYNREEAKSWKILALPALAEENDPLGRNIGESIWPERFPIEFLSNARRLNPRGFSALYQGRPTPDDGEFFKKDYLRTYQAHELPKNLRYYCSSDHAVSTKQDRDPTVLLPVGVDEDGIIWVLPDVWWRREQTDKVVDAMLAMMQRHKPIFWWAENGHISKAIGPFLRKRMVESNTYCSILEMTPVKDKRTRAQSIQAMASLGRVRFPAFAPWWGQAEQELLKFPAARHDDFVDALAWVGLGLNLQHNAPAPLSIAPKLKSGTLAWIKKQSRDEEIAKRLAYRDGF